MSVESASVSPRNGSEDGVTRFRAAWVRDLRIIGEPFSVMMFLLSYSRGPQPTRQMLLEDLGLSSASLDSALRKLEGAGYLQVNEARPEVFILLDPFDSELTETESPATSDQNDGVSM